MRRIWLVGGGTAGHVSPLLSLAEELEHQSAEEGVDITIVTGRTSTSRDLLSDADYAVKRMFSGKLRRYRGRNWLSRILDIKTWLLNIRDFFFIILGTIQAVISAVRGKPDIVFINGGSIGVPAAWAASVTGTPYIVHESDSVIGLANKLIAPHASKIATAFDVNLGPKLSGKTVRTGIPLKPQFLKAPDEDTLNNMVRGMNLDTGLPTVLAIGGSLGAERLNSWLISQADELLDGCQLVLVTGKRNYAGAQALKTELQPALAPRLHLMEFTDRMADLMRISDVIVTRAGATTLMEIAAIGKPAIIVPNDMLTGGHQSANAQWFVSAGMAESIPEASIAKDPSILVRSVHSLLGDEPRRRRLAQAITKAHMPDSSSVLAHLILEEGRGD